MKLNIADYLHKIDLALKDKPQKDIYMIYMLIVVSIFAFSYLLFWDTSLTSFKKIQKETKDIKSNIIADENYLRFNPRTKITVLNDEIAKINKKIIETKNNIAYIKSKTKTISSLIYNKRTWGKYLDSISKNAQNYHVKILNFSNKYRQSANSFGHILDISISSKASFKNTIKFINSLEQSDLVVDLHTFNMQADKILKSDLNISIWGITY